MAEARIESGCTVAKRDGSGRGCGANRNKGGCKNGGPGYGKGGGRGDIPGDQGDALAAFQHAIDGKLKTGLSRPDAMRAVAKEQPEVHAAYVQAHNDQVGPSNYRGRRG